MKGQRVKFTVEYEVDLDPVEGWGYQFNDWFKSVLNSNFMLQTHYNVSATLVGEPEFIPYFFIEGKGWTLMDEAGRRAVLEEMAREEIDEHDVNSCFLCEHGEPHVPVNMCYNICDDCEVGECEGK